MQKELKRFIKDVETSPKLQRLILRDDFYRQQFLDNQMELKGWEDAKKKFLDEINKEVIMCNGGGLIIDSLKQKVKEM